MDGVPTPMFMDKLKTCPFCGGYARVEKRRDQYFIKCFHKDICYLSNKLPPKFNVRDAMVSNKERLCFLTPRALYELKKYLNTRADDSPWVFVSRRAPHQKIGPLTIQHLLRKVGEEIGFRIHPHKLRHFFADNAHEAGLDILDISRMLGHESVDTTKIYLTANVDDLAYKHSKLR